MASANTFQTLLPIVKEVYPKKPKREKFSKIKKLIKGK